MKLLHPFLPAFALMILWPVGAAAQVHLDLAAGASLPLGNYASDSETDTDFATLGFTGFAGVAIPIGRSLELIANGGIASHGLDSSASVPDDLVSDVDLGRFRIHPLLAGARVKIPVGGAAIFVEGAAGTAWLKGPTLSSPDFELTYDWSRTFAWSVGGGVLLTRRLGIGARFIPLGDVVTEVRLPELPGLPETLEVEQPVSFLDVYLNLRLN